MKTILSLRKSIIVIAFALQVAITSCNSGSNNANTSASDTSKVAPATTQVEPAVQGTEAKATPPQEKHSKAAVERVTIANRAYTPASVTVTKGTKVIWTDDQAIMPHTVTSDTKGVFDSGDMHKKDTFAYVFNKAGTFTYYCTHHKSMHGTVIVKE